MNCLAKEAAEGCGSCPVLLPCYGQVLQVKGQTVKAACLSAPRLAQLHYSLHIMPSSYSLPPKIFLGTLPWPALLCTHRCFHSSKIFTSQCIQWERWSSQEKGWDPGKRSVERMKPKNQLLIRNETWLVRL